MTLAAIVSAFVLGGILGFFLAAILAAAKHHHPHDEKIVFVEWRE
jgi:hypothetical protein